MPWELPAYSRSRVDRAGGDLINPDASESEKDRALVVLSNWRSSHSFPLNTFQVRLRSKAREVYQYAVVAQRLKRLPSIEAKLNRFPKMSLSRMQDIGGCRAMVKTVSQVRKLRDSYTNSRIRHRLMNEKDYIKDPKSSGYRGIHLVYKYHSDRNDNYNGLLIEVQLRSRLQHIWATAVETVGTFLGHSLKASEGPEQWLRFFALCSSAFAVAERTALVPNTPTINDDLIRDLSEYADNLQVEYKLRGYKDALQIVGTKLSPVYHYFLLVLKPLKPRGMELRIHPYRKNELEQATEMYLKVEKEEVSKDEAQAVLVAADSLNALSRSYPNYFLDTELFLKQLTEAIRR